MRSQAQRSTSLCASQLRAVQPRVQLPFQGGHCHDYVPTLRFPSIRYRAYSESAAQPTRRSNSVRSIIKEIAQSFRRATCSTGCFRTRRYFLFHVQLHMNFTRTISVQPVSHFTRPNPLPTVDNSRCRSCRSTQAESPASRYGPPYRPEFRRRFHAKQSRAQTRNT